MDETKKEVTQKPMTPIEAFNLLSANIARLSGTRQDHAILMQAEWIVRQALGNAQPAASEEQKTEASPVGNA